MKPRRKKAKLKKAKAAPKKAKPKLEPTLARFNGEIMLLGMKYNIPTPFNSTLFNIVETMAAKGAQPGLCGIEELVDFAKKKAQSSEADQADAETPPR